MEPEIFFLSKQPLFHVSQLMKDPLIHTFPLLDIENTGAIEQLEWPQLLFNDAFVPSLSHNEVV